MTFSLSQLWVGIVLVVLQVAAALPWLAVLNRELLTSWFRPAGTGNPLARLLIGLAVIVGGGAALALFLGYGDVDPGSMQVWGGVYAAVLHAQLIMDCFVLVFAVLLPIWPKGAAVALAAFREGIRQPMFWFIVVLALALLLTMPFLPYFTFGEDFKMVKDLGYSTIMLCAAAFGILTASMSISEEIEGRTAITLMSKPVSRRQFLLGKFVGIVLAALLMTGILSWFFDGLLLFKLHWEREGIPLPDWLATVTPQWVDLLGESSAYFVRGGAWWFSHVVAIFPGVALGFCHAMVLTAIAVALATRLPMIANVVTCVVIFFLGNLAPILEQASQNSFALVHFMAQLFGNLLPGLDFFNLGAAIARDTPLPAPAFAAYVGSVILYALLYTGIALLFGLILFEDRDLA